MSINNRFMTPDKWYRSFLFLIVFFIFFFFVFPIRSFANSIEENKIIYSNNIYHKHTGSSGDGCYTIKRTGTKNEECDGGGQCNSGPHGPDTSGQVYYVGRCTKCGERVDRYGSPGYESCDSIKKVSYTYYDLGCNQSSETLLGILSVEQDTSEWTKEVVLTASFETIGNITAAETPYVWNGEATEQNTFVVTQNGDYTFRLNADANADTENGMVVIPVKNIDTTAPVIVSHTLEPESGWVKEGVFLTVGDTQDLQPDNTPGCGLHELAYSYDNGENWTADTSYLYEESGTYTVMVRDNLENVSSYEVSFFHIDNLAPTIEEVAYDDTPNVLSTMLTVTASDIQTDGSGGCGLHELPYSFDGGNTWTDNPSYETDRNGTITIAVRDALGNTVFREVEVTNIDGCGPAVSYRLSADSWTSQDVTLYLTAQDKNADGSAGIGLADKWYSLDGGSTWSNREELVFSENGKISVIARDKYNNLTYTDISVNCIDKDAPWVSLEMEVTNEGDKKVVTLIATGGDGGCGLHGQPYSWDNGSSYGNETRKVITQNGIYEVIVRDKIGNRSHKQIEVAVFEEPKEEIVPVIEVVESLPEEEKVFEEEKETQAEPEPEPEPVVIKAAPRTDAVPEKPVHVVEEDTWDMRDTLAVIGASGAGLSLIVLFVFCVVHTIAVSVEKENGNRHYLGRMWIHHKEERYEVRFTEALLEKCETTHFYLRPSLLFLIKRKDATLSLLFPEDICITLAVSKEMDFSLL